MTFTKTAHLPIPPDDAFALITEPERLRRWQVVAAVVDLRAGGSYRWIVTPGHVAAGTFKEVEPGRRIVFGWGWDGSPELPGDASTVTITVEPADGGSLVTLVHEGLTQEQAIAHAEGWNHYFERLEKLASTGTAGVDEWALAPQDLDPLSAAYAVLASIQPMLRGLTEADRQKASPCSEFTNHDLAEHLLQSLAQLAAMAGGQAVDPKGTALENRVSVMADQTIEAWRVHGLDGMVAGPGGGQLPASMGAAIVAIELLLHGWDLAQGSGQELQVSDEVVAYVRTLSEGIVPGGRGSSFADEVIPSPGASALDRLAAFAGRRPILA